jgi:Tol biopolymer transport system component
MWLIDAKTLETTTLVYPEGSIQGAAISPNGMLIAYIDSYRPKTLGSLWFVSSAGSDAYPTVDVGLGYMYPGAWSPDGSHLVYYGVCGKATDKGSPTGLCLLDIRTRQQIVLNVPYERFEPVWSPDNRQIDVAGLVPGDKACNAQPGLSAAEYEMCWYSTSGVFILDILTNESRFLTRGVAPIWSPDGSMLAFLSNRSGTTEIWTIRVDGSDLQQLTTDGQYKSPFHHVAWLPEAAR